MIHLSPKWAPYLKSQPEAGMSWQVVTVHLKDGRKFERVVVVGGTIASIAGDNDIPFAEADISELVVTNDTSWRR
jgi:hypothetical protein